MTIDVRVQLAPVNHHRNLRALCACLAILLVSLTSSCASDIDIQNSDNKITLVDKSDGLTASIDALGLVHSSAVSTQQKNYNTWIQSAFGSFMSPFPGALTVRAGISITSRHPQTYIGLDPTTGTFSLPDSLTPDGILDRDTLAIPIFELGENVIRDWSILKRDCEDARQSGMLDARMTCDQFSPRYDDKLPGWVNTTSADPFLFGVRYVELLKATNELLDFQALVQGMTMITANGESFDSDQDMEAYATRFANCRSLQRFPPPPPDDSKWHCELNPGDFSYPVDWLTEHVDERSLTPDFIRSLRAAEYLLRVRLTAIDSEVEMSHQLLHASAASNDW